MGPAPLLYMAKLASRPLLAAGGARADDVEDSKWTPQRVRGRSHTFSGMTRM